MITLNQIERLRQKLFKKIERRKELDEQIKKDTTLLQQLFIY